MNDSGKKLVLTKKVYKEIFEAYYKPLCLFVRKLVESEPEAEDIVHNVFLVVWEKRTMFNEQEHLKAFLFRVAYNQAVTYIHHHRFIRRALGNMALEEKEEENYLKKRIETEVFFEIQQALEQLPQRCRKVFELSYLEGLKVSQVAERLNISEETVKTQRLIARKHLQKTLKNLFALGWVLLLGTQ